MRVGVGGGLVPLQSLLTIKKGISPLNLQSNEPFLKFLQQWFLYKSYMPPGHNLQPWPWRLWGSLLLKKHNFFVEINYAEQNGYLKILMGCVWENDGRGGGASFPSITFDY